MTSRTHFVAFSLLLALLAQTVAHAADWPPELDSRNTTTQSTDGRTIERFVHGRRDTWGYPAGADDEWAYPSAQGTGAPGQNHNSFYLVAPRTPRPGSPLCVVLHSANRTAYDYMAFTHLGRKIGGGDDPATIATRSPEDFYALYLSSTNSE